MHVLLFEEQYNPKYVAQVSPIELELNKQEAP